MFQFASSPGCVPSKAMKICMNSTGVNKIEQTDKLLLETLHETRSKSEEEEDSLAKLPRWKREKVLKEREIKAAKEADCPAVLTELVHCTLPWDY